MKKAIILSKNYIKYRSGYYHQDLVDALQKNLDFYIYGEGYENYDKNDDIYDVISKSKFDQKDIDYIIMTTSWDDDVSEDNVDPHPKINTSSLNEIKKIYFLNKEYKKLSSRFDYCKKNKIDEVFTVHPNAELWSKEQSLNIKQMHFGISLERFGYDGEPKKIDFAFTGSLHNSHLDYRSKVKEELFIKERLHTKSNFDWRNFGKNVLKPEYNMLNIYWAEFGARDIFYRNLLPFDKKYGRFLKETKMMLNTPSAVGIFNTRFFELMASKTLILCPRVDSYNGLLEDNTNCLMYNPDMSDFQDVFMRGVNDVLLREKIVNNAYENVKEHSYDARVKSIL